MMDSDANIAYPRTAGGGLTDYERSSLASSAFQAGYVDDIDPGCCDGLFWQFVLTQYPSIDSEQRGQLAQLQSSGQYERLVEICATAFLMVSPDRIPSSDQFVATLLEVAGLKSTDPSFLWSLPPGALKCALLLTNPLADESDGSTWHSYIRLLSENAKRALHRRARDDREYVATLRKLTEELNRRGGRRNDDERAESIASALELYEHSSPLLQLILQTLHPNLVGAIKELVLSYFAGAEGNELASGVGILTFALVMHFLLPHGALEALASNTKGLIDDDLLNVLLEDDPALTQSLDELRKHLGAIDAIVKAHQAVSLDGAAKLAGSTGVSAANVGLNALKEPFKETQEAFKRIRDSIDNHKSPALGDIAKIAHDSSEAASTLITVGKIGLRVTHRTPANALDIAARILDVVGTESELLEDLAVLKLDPFACDLVLHGLILESMERPNRHSEKQKSAGR